MAYSLIDKELYGLTRCPQCGIARPLLRLVDNIHFHHLESGYNSKQYWYFTARCSHCEKHALFYGWCTPPSNGHKGQPEVLEIVESYPELASAAEELPALAGRFFQQAIESRHAPDGALMLAASSIDAMLKDKSYTKGSLYDRIIKARDDGLLTEDMASWAHEIRLSANEPRHADEAFQGATSDEADQIIAFAKALGEYLYVLPARVHRWQAKVDSAKVA